MRFVLSSTRDASQAAIHATSRYAPTVPANVKSANPFFAGHAWKMAFVLIVKKQRRN